MSNTNLSKVKVSKKDETFTADKASTGAFSRWLETDKQRLRVVKYPTGYEADHVCYEGHAFFVTEGSIKIEMGEEVAEWETGDAFIIPGDVPHRVFNPYDDDATVVVVDHG